MVRQPKGLAEAKQIFKEERTKVASSLSAIAGSRWLTAILATFALAFGTHLAYAPGRLPPVSGLSLAQIGLPTGVDFGFVGEGQGSGGGRAHSGRQRPRAGGHRRKPRTRTVDQHDRLWPRARAAGRQYVDHDDAPANDARLARPLTRASKAEAKSGTRAKFAAWPFRPRSWRDHDELDCAGRRLQRLAEREHAFAAGDRGADAQAPFPKAPRVGGAAAVFDHRERAHHQAAPQISGLPKARGDNARRAQFGVQALQLIVHLLRERRQRARRRGRAWRRRSRRGRRSAGAQHQDSEHQSAHRRA
jgi:hypothetical protein